MYIYIHKAKGLSKMPYRKLKQVKSFPSLERNFALSQNPRGLPSTQPTCRQPLKIMNKYETLIKSFEHNDVPQKFSSYNWELIFFYFHCKLFIPRNNFHGLSLSFFFFLISRQNFAFLSDLINVKKCAKIVKNSQKFGKWEKYR